MPSFALYIIKPNVFKLWELSKTLLYRFFSGYSSTRKKWTTFPAVWSKLQYRACHVPKRIMCFQRQGSLLPYEVLSWKSRSSTYRVDVTIFFMRQKLLIRSIMKNLKFLLEPLLEGILVYIGVRLVVILAWNVQEVTCPW